MVCQEKNIIAPSREVRLWVLALGSQEQLFCVMCLLPRPRLYTLFCFGFCALRLFGTTWAINTDQWYLNMNTAHLDLQNHASILAHNYRLITAYLLLRVNLDKIMHARWDFDASSARTRRVSALDRHQNWSASALFCQNSRAQSKYAVVNLIHTWRKQTFLSFIMW